ncbi:hypothetical protein EV426DRAFT_337351 [Tirmania nivea]|nr:hypothetical protein EV426DRAFT_337351 [Tirmania nivea]
MHYSGIFIALTALSSFAAALPRPFSVTPPKAVSIKYDTLHSIRSVNENTGVITRRAIDSGAKILRPIKVHHSFTKRSDDDDPDSIDFSRLDLSKQAQLIYGSPNSDGSVLLADMTLYAPDGKPIIMMESFETLTSAIDCNGSDGKLSLTFRNNKAMMYALTKWAYINEKEEDEFILIANHESCGPSEERIPYLISDVKNDGLVTYLTAKKEKWENISGKFVIDFGKAQVSSDKTAQARTRRGFGDLFNTVKDKIKQGTDKIEETVQNGVDKAKEGADVIGETVKNGVDQASEKLKTVGGKVEKEILIPLNTGQVGNIAPIFMDPLGLLTVTCDDCNIAGSLKLVGRVAVESFKPTELTFSASPVDLSTTIQLGVTISVGSNDMKTPPTFSKSIATLPLGGIVIPQIFSLGPTLDFEMGASLSVDHDGSFTFGIKAALPNEAIINANVLDPLKSNASGFDGATAEAIPFTVGSLSGSMTASAFAMPVLSIGFEVLGGVFGAETSIKFKVPSFNADISAEFDPLGVCKQDAGASKTGVKIKTSGVADATFFVGTDQTIGEIAAVNKVLFKKEFMTIPATCIEVDIPGLDKTVDAPVDTTPADETTAETPVDETTVDAPVDETTLDTPVDEITPVDETTSVDESTPIDETTPVDEATPLPETTVDTPVEETTVDAPVDETLATDAPVKRALLVYI